MNIYLIEWGINFNKINIILFASIAVANNFSPKININFVVYGFAIEYFVHCAFAFEFRLGLIFFYPFSYNFFFFVSSSMSLLNLIKFINFRNAMK